MLQIEPTSSLDHVLDSRLFAVAKSYGDEFTSHEFNHLRECLICFQLWTKFIFDSGSDEENPG
jgi:hypothetical protein